MRVYQGGLPDELKMVCRVNFVEDFLQDTKLHKLGAEIMYSD
jgi:hypothetical protein